MTPIQQPEGQVSDPPHANSARAFGTVTALFFTWGFITSLIDPLVAAMKGIFTLSNVEAQLSTFAFFIAYGLISLPAAALLARLGPVRGIMIALSVIAAACMLIRSAGSWATYEGVLLGLFLLAGGITILQVAANPLAARLGAADRSHFRLVLSQGFNSLGTVAGPLVGSYLFLKRLELAHGVALEPARQASALHLISNAFLSLAALVGALAGFVWVMRRYLSRPIAGGQRSVGIGEIVRAGLGSRWALFGAIAIFCYVGAEVFIGTQMALFLHDPQVWGTPLQRAGYFVSLYWLGAMLGRFVGSALLIYVPAPRLLALAAAIAALLCLCVLAMGGVGAGYAALSIGLFNSIMFPTIFTLTLERSTAGADTTAGFLCTAIVGGAFLPLVGGAIADAHGYTASFVLPMVCYLLLSGFALIATRSAGPRHA